MTATINTESFHSDMESIKKELVFSDLKDQLYDCFYNWREDCFTFDEDTFFYFLYDICNYDFIRVNEHSIDIKESNHPDIAKVLAKYASKENINRVYHNLYRR